MEQWRPIAGYEGLYEVSDMGNVKSLRREVRMPKGGIRIVEEKLLVMLYLRGYQRCHLAKDGRVKNAQVHRLVAEAFIPNPENKPQVNHKNGIKTDNRASELEWATHRENEDHATVNGLKASGERNSNSVLNPESVQRLLARREETGLSIYALAGEFGVSKSTVSNIINNNHWALS